MKIVHLILNGILTDYFTYQDNLLTKYHKKLGFDVTAITNEYIYNHGELIKDNRNDYINEDGVHVIRLKIKNNKSFNYKFKTYEKLINTLENEKPDILFIHSCCFIDIKKVVKYLKENKNVVVFLDNHCDKSNSGTNFISYNILHKIIWKHYAQLIDPYVKRFYGVMPSRVNWLTDVYKLPKDKCKLLVMGADDELVKKYNIKREIKNTRELLHIEPNDFLIVTGGKIDKAKQQTFNLFESVLRLNNKRVKLLFFGSVIDEFKERFDKLCQNKQIINMGWATNEETYKYLSIADLVVFPGRHSVYWEITVALKKPMICRYWDGTTHIDIGDNVEFIKKDNELYSILEKVVDDGNKYNNLKNNAEKNDDGKFLYSNIAKKSICLIE